MAISVIGGGSSAAATSATSWITITTANAPYILNQAFPIGVYRVRAFATALQSTPAATVNFMDASSNVVKTVTTVDANSADSYNPSEGYVSITTSNVVKISISTTAAGLIAVENVGVTSTANLISVLTYSTSQTVTVANTAGCILIGGGGGGCGGMSTSAGGGGSGYIQKFSITAGSYPLVIGAGGGFTGNGSTAGTGGVSTFNGYTANGGLGGSNTVGGAGGSGGGGGGGGTGGYNGSAGAGSGGTGSGVTFPYWTLPQTAPTAQQNSGGLYAGGGGGSGGGGNPGATIPNTGGGGASAGNNGANGSNGVLLLAYGV